MLICIETITEQLIRTTFLLKFHVYDTVIRKIIVNKIKNKTKNYLNMCENLAKFMY